MRRSLWRNGIKAGRWAVAIVGSECDEFTNLEKRRLKGLWSRKSGRNWWWETDERVGSGEDEGKEGRRQ